MKRPVFFAAALAAGLGLAIPLVVAQQPAAAPKELIHAPLIGGVYEEMIMAEATVAPNARVPWHIHQDAHEIAYVLEGTIKVQPDNGPEREVKAGEGFHFDANVVHRGQAGAIGARVLVVRLKPKDAPITQMVTHTD